MAKSGLIFRVFPNEGQLPDTNNRFFDCSIHTFLQVEIFWNISMSLQYQQVGRRLPAQPICYFR